MTTPDPLAVRMYENAVKGQQDNASAALDHLRRAVDSMDVNLVGLALSTARNAATTLAELTAALSALKAAEDLRFLVKED